MNRRASSALRGALALAIVLGVAGAPDAAEATGPTILGAGSTWSQIAIDQWRSDVTHLGLSVNYQGVGSTSGRQFFAADTVDFAVSEIPFQPDDPPNHRAFDYLPIVAGGTSMMYNLKSASGEQVRDLRLSPATIALIFTGKITRWSDPRIQADYPKPLPNLPIRVIVRSDGSGTSAQFSAYIAATEPATWRSFTHACGIPDTFTSFWPSGRSNCLPNGVGQRGSDGIANWVANPALGLGSIGYVEAAYAVARQFPVVQVKNASGHYTVPTAQNVAIALQHATLNPDSTQKLADVYTAAEADAYPISSYSYMIVPTDSSITTDKGGVLGNFIIYFACTGQQAAQRLGYSPLPKPLVQFAFSAEQDIPGAPNPPALTSNACPNPTFTHDFTKGGGGTLPGTVLYTAGGGGNHGGGPTDTSTPTGTDSASPVATDSNGSPVPTDSNGVPISGTTTVITRTPEVLTGAELAAAKRAADERINGMRPADAFPLIAVAIVVLVLIVGPLFLRLRSSRWE